MLTILRAGMATSVQDAGRYHYSQSGISLSGALDLPAMKTANLLAGNPENSAVLEVTFGQAQFIFGRDSWFALTGAGCEAELEGKPVWTGWRTFARAGQVLTLHRALRGVRSYLAINGGFDLPEVMGSVSTDLKAGFGGWQGRYLRDGDQLPLNPPTREFSHSAGVRQLLWGNRVRVIPGPNTMSSAADPVRHSGVQAGRCQLRVTGWGSVYRAGNSNGRAAGSYSPMRCCRGRYRSLTADSLWF
ncbi:Allophanate hydrolase subunit 2 [Tatumella ptyseos]|uniref:Allophanate hydrolase subunit 2 n=1 Tax=Tatumella ptyseos TaxID=82987 RepID=A0A2X5NLR8_9GAMM|nr:Allophanate hydrolase subunit 2 [Tatumella ptyseos]